MWLCVRRLTRLSLAVWVSAVKWIIRQGINVLTMSPGKKDYGHHNYPLERIEKAITWLRAHGNRKIAIAGASTTGTLALTAAAMFPEITLTIAMAPSDFVWQGFMQGKKDGCKEWPIEGESLFAYHGKPLPYMPFCYQHPDYWNCIAAETKRTGDMINSRKLFDDSEAAHPIQPEEFIPIENIQERSCSLSRGRCAVGYRQVHPPYGLACKAGYYLQGGRSSGLSPRNPLCFPGRNAEDDASSGADLFVRLAFQGQKNILEGMQTDPSGYRPPHAIGHSVMEMRSIKIP